MMAPREGLTRKEAQQFQREQVQELQAGLEIASASFMALHVLPHMCIPLYECCCCILLTDTLHTLGLLTPTPP